MYQYYIERLSWYDYSHMSLYDRRELVCKRFFYSIKKAAWTIYYLSQETQRQSKDYNTESVLLSTW